MWAFTRHGFISVVQNRDVADNFLVRSRDVRPLQELWPNHDIITLKDADYRFRINVNKDEVMGALGEHILSIDYDNFKNECVDDREYLKSLGSVWRVMYEYQLRVGDRNEG